VEKETNEPKVFDPASYYGHNEAECVRRIQVHLIFGAHHPNSLAIARMFGGFPESFYTTYHNKFPESEPIDEYWDRANLYEIFHYLNHALLFGVSQLFLERCLLT
jgi:fructosamine-3-kinase